MTKILYKDINLKLGSRVVLDNINLDIDGNQIIGVIGRRGSGKTYLMSVLASLKYPTSGELTVDGENPFDNSELMAKTIYTSQTQSMKKNGTLEETLQFCHNLRPTWDIHYAHKLMSTFGISKNLRVQKLTSNRRAVFNSICGLASRCPITIFNETFEALDEDQREIFFEALLKDQARYPRTFFLVTDNPDPIQHLLQDVIIMNNGKDISHGTVQEITLVARRIMKLDEVPGLGDVILNFTEEGGVFHE